MQLIIYGWYCSCKNEVISKIYKDPAGRGSISETYQDVKKVDKTITLSDVKQWMDSNTQKRQNLKGYNSYVANAPYEQYQVDLFFMNDFPDQN